MRIGENTVGRITVSFPYNPDYISKIKNIEGYRWYPEEKYRSFPNNNETLEKILKVSEGEKIQFAPALQNVISGKYSYKTVKAYIYFSRDFLNFSGKSLAGINDIDIKDYLLVLSKEEVAKLLSSIENIKHKAICDACRFCGIEGWGSGKIKARGY